NFQGYTTKAGADLYGMGVTAISGFRDAYAQNFRELPAWEKAIAERGIATMRGYHLSGEDRLRREVISRLLCHTVIPKREISEAFGIDFDQHFAQEMERLESPREDGLLTVEGDEIRASWPGGVIQSIEEGGYLFELGPQSFSATSEVAELCGDLGLAGELLEAPHGAPRYVLIGDKLVSVPLSPALLTSNLLSLSTKFSFLRDVLGKTSPPDMDESIAAFVQRKFSAELLDRLVGPFVSGIYAGD